MKEEKDLERESSEVGEKEKILTRGEVIKLVPEVNFGVLQTEEDEFLFFHISSFIDESITMDDIKEGDLIMCEKEVQKSDGKKSAINCRMIEMKSYLKDYLVENALVAPGDVEIFDDFCEHAREYSEKVGKEDFKEEDKAELRDLINNTKTVMQLKLTRPKLAIITSKYMQNKIIAEFLEMLDEIIKNIKPSPGNTEEMDNFKIFIDIIFSYMELA